MVWCVMVEAPVDCEQLQAGACKCGANTYYRAAPGLRPVLESHAYQPLPLPTVSLDRTSWRGVCALLPSVAVAGAPVTMDSSLCT